MDASVANRLDSIERRLRTYRIALFCSLLLLAFTLSSNVISSPGTTDIMRVKGLIIEDAQGRPRIIMGAPAPKVAGRERTDELVGIAYLDESGADRVTLGRQPDPMTIEGIKSRRIGGAGILIHDKEGIERGGYGVLDDGLALLTLDWPKSSEGVALVSGEQFSALQLYHDAGLGKYKSALALTVTQNNGDAFINFNERVVVKSQGEEDVQLLIFDKDGKEVSSKPVGGGL